MIINNNKNKIIKKNIKQKHKIINKVATKRMCLLNLKCKR